MAPPTSIPPHLVPPNCSFVEFNAETDWSGVEKLIPAGRFDFIHSRLLTVGVKDWPSVFKNCFQYLKPGGWLEVTDVTDQRGGKAASFKAETSAFEKAFVNMCAETTKTGVNWKAYDTHTAYLQAAGFDDIRKTDVVWKIGDWGNTDQDREAGRLGKNNCMAILSQLPRFCPNLPAEEVATLQREAQTEVRDDAEKLQLYLTV